MSMRPARLASTVSILAVTVACAYGGLHAMLTATAERMVRDAAGPGRSVAIGDVRVEPLSGRIAIRDIAVTTPAGRARIATVVLHGPSLMSRAAAQQAFSVEGITFEAAGASYAIPRLDVTGADMTADDVRAVFDPSSTQPLSARLARLNAEAITIPEMLATATQDDVTSRVTYADVRIFGLKAGVIRSLAAAGVAFSTTSDTAPALKGEVGPMAATTIDLPWIAKAYTEKAEPGDTAMRLGYASYSIDGIAVATTARDGTPLGKASVGRIVGKDFRLRPSREPWLSVFQELVARQGSNAQDLPPETRSRLVLALTDIIESSEIGLFEATDLRASGASDLDGVVRLARMSYAGAAVGRPNEVRLEGFEYAGRDASGRFGTILHTGFSFAPTVKALRETLGRPDVDPADIDARTFLPEFGTFTLRDVVMRVPPSQGDAGPTRVGMQTLEISATEPLGGIPTSLRLALDRLTLDIPPATPDEGLRDLISLGYKDVDLSMGFDARWRESDNAISLGNVSIQGVNMGSSTLRATFGNVTRDVFVGDATASQMALLGITFRQAQLTLENRGLFERVLDREARRQKMSRDQMRRELTRAAQMAIPGLLGSTPTATAVTAAVTKFIAKPNRLVISARSASDMGVGIADILMAGGDPAALLDQVKLTATAE